MAPQLVLAFLAALVIAFVLAAAEAAIGRVSRVAAQDWREEGRRGAQALCMVLGDSAGYLSVSTFARVMAESTAAVLATIAAAALLDGFWPVLLSAIGVMVVASFVIGGVSPRTLGRQHAENVALAAAGPLVWLRRLLGPLARLLVALANAVTPGRGYRDGPFDSEAELRDLVDLAGDSAVIEDQEREMIHSVFELGDTVAREVMVPRPDMVAIDEDKNLRAAMALFLRSGFSRVPVLGEDADDPRGLLYFKDVARRLHDHPFEATALVTEVMRPVPYVPDSKPVDALLREMQRDQTHLAIVVDEYGGTAGLVTIEDLLEEIVGEIADEFDREGPGVEELDDGSVRVPATMHIDDLGELFDVEFDDEDVDTVGGLLTKAIGRVPILGASGKVGGLELTAERMAGRRHRIASVLVRRAVVGQDGLRELEARDRPRAEASAERS
ncbi:MAG: HlyC/CorC family transporter [Austwickia sp.]|jgi:CBS domain containing-hemolysin-like protein|nr:HlyC/CorC family transporter [Austwickia sp.]MBK8435126.1 HlyC/CorC family transporter [Austwickia sp.]MBK9101321.1 HlyC/CorC family transporter [Austwickia sp.]